MINVEMFYGRQTTAISCREDEEELNELPSLEKRPAVKIDKKFLFCQRCGKKTPLKEVLLPNGDFYCPHCIMLGRMSTSTILYSIKEPNAFQKYGSDVLSWHGKLSNQQKTASDSLLKAASLPGDHLLWAVTGAGKTEMTFATLQDALIKGKRICFAAPRIDVINELFPRLKAAFATVDIICLHSRSNAKYRYTQFVLCTTHQLMRFYRAFDLIIIDEVDSFPFLGNESLEYAAKNALKAGGTRLFLTATPDEKLQRRIKKKEIDVIYLPIRFHQNPLPVPKVVCCFRLREKLFSERIPGAVKKSLTEFENEGYPFLVFVPTIDLLEKVHEILSESCSGTTVHAGDPERIEKVQAMRDGKYRYLVTTTILERGVTFPKLNVLVLCADASEFNLPALVQIAGRAGRSSERPDGHVRFFCDNYTKRVKGSIEQIKRMNRKARRYCK